VAWILEAEGKKIIHAGDTLWHGHWWNIANQYGPFDATCLPVNGAVIQEEGMTYSDQPICLTPEQAVSAAQILGAKMLIPIHYGAFHNPPIYNETPDIIERLTAASTAKGVPIHLLKNSENIAII
jgi:L-ascorbate metabolism protein UlaG (beta-lactamase superfamily)